MTTDASYETVEIFDSDGGFCNLSFDYKIDYSNLLVELQMTNSISQHLCRFTADKYSVKFDDNIQPKMVKGTHQKYSVLTPQEFEDILEPEPEIIICYEEEEP